MLKNILYISGSIAVFFAGMISYGIILNLNEITLAEAMKNNGVDKLENVKLIVDRRNYKIELYSGNKLIKTYKAVFGKNNSTVKTSKDDLVTPIGDYHVCEMIPNHKYQKFIKLNYPNDKDAGEALKQGYINENEFDDIIGAFAKKECPPASTKLGAFVGLQGIGEFDFIFKNLPFPFNWTDGSIAVSNQGIDELYSVVKIGTYVKIRF